jgi:hypothetical protein
MHCHPDCIHQCVSIIHLDAKIQYLSLLSAQLAGGVDDPVYQIQILTL